MSQFSTGRVTLSSAEAEFVAASQAGQEAVYLRALLRGFNFQQVGDTEIWEDNASCIMMSENPANRERTRHVHTRVYYLREQKCDNLILLPRPFRLFCGKLRAHFHTHRAPGIVCPGPLAQSS